MKCVVTQLEAWDRPGTIGRMQISPLSIPATNPTFMDRQFDIVDRVDVDGTLLDEVLVEMTRASAMGEIERLLREVGEALGREA